MLNSNYDLITKDSFQLLQAKINSGQLILLWIKNKWGWKYVKI